MKIKHKLKHQIHSKRNKHPEQVGVRILAKSRNVKLFDREIHYLSFSIRNNIIFFVKGIYTEDDSKLAGKKDRF
nr:MAG TPA: hypothetical protein [Inoviridae sp.]